MLIVMVETIMCSVADGQKPNRKMQTARQTDRIRNNYKNYKKNYNNYKLAGYRVCEYGWKSKSN